MLLGLLCHSKSESLAVCSHYYSTKMTCKVQTRNPGSVLEGLGASFAGSCSAWVSSRIEPPTHAFHHIVIQKMPKDKKPLQI